MKKESIKHHGTTFAATLGTALHPISTSPPLSLLSLLGLPFSLTFS